MQWYIWHTRRKKTHNHSHARILAFTCPHFWYFKPAYYPHFRKKYTSTTPAFWLNLTRGRLWQHCTSLQDGGLQAQPESGGAGGTEGRHQEEGREVGRHLEECLDLALTLTKLIRTSVLNKLRISGACSGNGASWILELYLLCFSLICSGKLFLLFHIGRCLTNTCKIIDHCEVSGV